MASLKNLIDGRSGVAPRPWTLEPRILKVWGDQESWNTMANKHYPAEFKADAVALYRSRPGATIAQTADDLGVNRETLRSWVRADDRRRSGPAGPVGPAGSAGSAKPQGSGSVEDENARLRRRIRELEEERDI